LKKKDFNNPDPNNQGDNPANGGNAMNFEKEFKAEQAKNEKLTKDLETSQEEAKAGIDEDGKSFKEKFEASEKTAKDLQAGIDKDKADAKTKEFSDFAESLAKEEKILPSSKDAIIAMQKALDGQEAIDFGEGDDKKKITPLDLWKEQIEKGDISGLFGEKFQGSKSPADAISAEIKAETDKLMEDGKRSFTEASAKLRKDKPELFKSLSFTEELKDE